MNTQQAQKIFTQRIQYNNEKTPSGIDPKTPELSTQEPGLQKIVKKIKDLMKTRPMWTRRALINVLGSRDTTVKQATQYVGYMFTSGPWRDTIIRYGLDPRTDPSCRFYQSFGFQIVSNEPGEDGKNPDWAEDKVNYQRNNQTNAPATASHIFDGKTLIRDGKVWQVCDVTDPLLHGLLATKDIRPTCDVSLDPAFPKRISD
jgi:general transcription factor 3C polypeptide 5 (transcription factor C subunit 1)